MDLNLKNEERFKKVQLELQRAGAKKHNSSYASSVWPSYSTIQPEISDVSYINAAASLQTSKEGSEVLARSSNLFKQFPLKPKATSSVKDAPINNDKDRAMMPPPLPPNNFNRKSNLFNKRESYCNSPNKTGIGIPVKVFEDDMIKKHSDPLEFKVPFIYHKWTIKLNRHKELEISGKLEISGQL